MANRYKVCVDLWVINNRKPKYFISIDNDPITLKTAKKLLDNLSDAIDKLEELTAPPDSKKKESTFVCDRCEKTAQGEGKFAHGKRCGMTGDCDEDCRMLCSTCHEAVLYGGSLEKDEDEEVECESCGVMISECDVEDIRLCDDCNEKFLEGN